MLQPIKGSLVLKSITCPFIFPVVPANRGNIRIKYKKFLYIELSITHRDRIIFTRATISITFITPSPVRSLAQNPVSSSVPPNI